MNEKNAFRHEMNLIEMTFCGHRSPERAVVVSPFGARFQSRF